jgi:osmotically-inducible protein OsmY
MNELLTSGGYAFELWMADGDLAAVQPAIDGALAEAGVHVMTDTHEGVARLTGSVPSYAEKLAARAAVMSVPGIWRLDDEIVVEPSRAERFLVDDDTLRHRIVMALAWDSRLHGGVAVVVEEGCVTLGGTVASDAERQAVLEVVTRMHGVRDVFNTMEVPPLPRPIHATDRVEEAIEHALGRDARHVRVSVTDAGVELKGWVRTLAQVAAAERAVRRMLGDVALENGLRVKH